MDDDSERTRETRFDASGGWNPVPPPSFAGRDPSGSGVRRKPAAADFFGGVAAAQ